MKNKIAFIHLMKTAGSHLQHYLLDHVIQEHLRLIPWNHQLRFRRDETVTKRSRDWNMSEMIRLLRLRNSGPTYIHNHVNHWNAQLHSLAKKEDYFTFMFLRHPGDILCSHYYYTRERDIHWDLAYPKDVSLNFYLQRILNCANDHVWWQIPIWYKQIDYVKLYTDTNFHEFLQEHFDHDDYLKNKPNLTHENNKTQNPGWAKLCESGDINKENQTLLERHQQMRLFEELTG